MASSSLNPAHVSSSVDSYQPTARRPIADLFRRTAHVAVRLCVRARIHPDTISYLSMVAAALAGACFWYAGRHAWLLLLGPVFCYLRLWCNMLDGMVALASNTASPRGEILNDLPDRVSDVLIFAGVAHSGLCSPFSGYWAALLAVFTAYVGMLGQAVGARREFGGIMSKPWRMVVLHVGAWTLYALITVRGGSSEVRFGGLTVLDWTCVVVIAGCVQTVFVRLRQTFRALASRPASPVKVKLSP
jgi:phosphatidylglycerophosphate synthase